MLIGIDMDGVIVDFIGRLLETYAQKHGRKFTPDDVHEHSLRKVFGSEQYARMAAIFNQSGFFSWLHPYSGAIGTVEMLLDAGHDIEIISSPTTVHAAAGNNYINGLVAAEKIDWISRHLPRLSTKVTITKRKEMMRVDVLVDDADHNVLPWCQAHPDGTAVLVAQPWNRSVVLPSNAVRAEFIRLPELLQEMAQR
jgi:5'(3')-deoxyribonucleotidase